MAQAGDGNTASLPKKDVLNEMNDNSSKTSATGWQMSDNQNVYEQNSRKTVIYSRSKNQETHTNDDQKVNEQNSCKTVIYSRSKNQETHTNGPPASKKIPDKSKETLPKPPDPKEKENASADSGKGNENARPRRRKPKRTQSESDDFFKRNSRQKQTSVLYVKFEQHLEPKYDVTAFLKQRMGDEKNVNFSVKKKEVVGAGTVVSLEFDSKNKAQRAAKLLKQSNRGSQMKLFCTLKKDEAMEAVKDEAEFKRQLEQITRRAQRATNNHDEKIRLTDSKITSLSTNKHVSLEEFKQRQVEKDALKDKLKELENQGKQFTSFLSSLVKKLTDVWKNNTYDKYITDLRREFGVECCRLENALPMYARRNDILTLVKENQVSVILGETGSGKSTQMTQYLHQAGLSQTGIIVCTQPRKVAAISLATHVASEMATSVGNVVGYKVGMRSKTSGATRILYMTDHCLLNECLKDPTLSAYSCVIVDEAHERSIYTDLLLGMLKMCMKQRPELKAIITSATIDPDVFVRYFGTCPVLRVSGRMFPVEVTYEPNEDGERTYIDDAVCKAESIHKTESPGDILIFVTSPLETEQCSEKLKLKLQGRTDYKCLILHGQIQPEEQQLVFQPCATGIRKIVFATNSAETSITIPGIKYVVDTGLVKEKRYDPRRNMSSLSVVVISRSSADQRKGRAGRTGPGKCYRLYSEQQYVEMDPVAQPEILKVHLGQAMLKLSELGINPLQYEFVQSPGETAIKTAMETLEELGAVKDNKITDDGRELAKLPVEPRLGLIIQKGRSQGACFDAIVLSAVSSMGSSIYFRGGSDDDKKKADKLKIQFCHKGGDSLSLMNVYRTWNSQPEKQKNKWCFENSINSKSIRNAREIVNEITTIIKKESKKKIEHVLQDPNVVDGKLQKILFESYVSNICHYLGHVRAGYIAAKLDQQVHNHPSSVLNPLNSTPEWLVFEQSLKTSKDFITGLTPVEEAWIVEAIEAGRLKTNLEEMRNKRLAEVHTEHVGSNIFRAIVGPQFTKLRTLGDTASELVKPALAIIEASRDKGELKVLSSEHSTDKLGQLFKPVITKVRESMLTEDLEFPLSRKNENAGIRAIIGEGGAVKDILMSDEFRTVFVEKPNEDSDENTIIKKFSRFGKIKEHRVFKNPYKRWGCITFQSSEDAKHAVQQTKEDDAEIAVPEKHGRGYQNSDFKVKITWCRRASKGIGFVDVAPEDLPRISRHGVINIKGRLVEISLDRKTQQSLFLRNLGKEVNENDIRSAILKLFTKEEREQDIIRKVTVVREKINTDTEDMDGMYEELFESIQTYVPKERFRLDVKKPRNPGTAFHLAFAMFKNPDEGIATCQGLSRLMYIGNKVVTMEPEIRSSIYINSDVYAAVKEDLDNYLDNYENLGYSGVTISSKTLRNGTVVLNIDASSALELAKVRASLQEIIQGDVLECGYTPHLRYLFSRSGRDFLMDAAKKNGAHIQTDYRNLTISIRGKQRAITMVRSDINNYLSSFVNGEWKEMNLRGNNRPNGLMKALMNKYGLDLERLQQKTSLTSLILNFKQQIVKMSGRSENIEKATAVIDTMSAKLQEGKQKLADDEDQPDCNACFCPIEDKELYRLEYCGHAYCLECIKRQIEIALKDKDLPIRCCQEDCGQPVMWRDLTFLSKQGSCTIGNLAESAVSSFVLGNSRLFKYCLTPDCNMVYKVTSTGAVFQCPECNMRICTTCHTQYHDGLTCAMYNSAKEDEGNLDVYLKLHSQTKKCPNCTTPIEKIEGCNKMTCGACKCCFCWLCLAFFKDEHACYAHLRAKHGGYM